MDDLGQISSDEMVLAFLDAEIDSPRWRDRYPDVGLQPGDTGTSADLTDDAQNERRRATLAAGRGYGTNSLLFRGLPADVVWHRVRVTTAELGDFLHLNYKTFLQLTGGTRLVRDGAANAVSVSTEETLAERVLELSDLVSGGMSFPPLIVVAKDLETTPVVLEGNTRASAYLRALPEDALVEVIFGHSPSIDSMHFY